MGTGVNVPPKPGRSGDPSSSTPPPDRLSGLLGSGLSVNPVASNNLGSLPRIPKIAQQPQKASPAPSDRLSSLLASGLSVKPAVDSTSQPRANDEKEKTTSSQTSLLASGLSVKPATE